MFFFEQGAAGQEAESVGQVEIEGVMLGIDQWTEAASKRTIEGVIHGIDQGAVGGSDKGIERTGHKVDDEGSEGYKRDDVDDVYFVKVRYLPNGNDDEELQAEYYDSDDHGRITKCSLKEEDDGYCEKDENYVFGVQSKP
ncbi:hypothetical protein V6N11_071400 [Hibiscus sabdariffa]|uniref:Uncharacterized protein n=1 Tax=Hibiscus sabdariffa TaxID=183260 RepID=A0ABR2U071_9ROSI